MDSRQRAREILRRAEQYAAAPVGVCAHTDDIAAGDIFLARENGARYIDAALRQGASVAVRDARHKIAARGNDRVVAVDDFENTVAALLDMVYGPALSEVSLVGVTGTNGKTGTARFLCDLLNALGDNMGDKAGYIGTSGYGVGDETTPTRNTTPDGVTLRRYIADLRGRGCETIVLEVSSHAIALRRIAGLSFAAAVFTNLSRDHLDFHGTMRAYAAAKKSFFNDYPIERVAANVDDDTGREIARDCAKAKPGRVIGFSEARPRDDVNTLSYDANDVDNVDDMSALNVAYAGETATLKCGVGGRLNMKNLAAAVSACVSLGYSLPAIAAAASCLRPVPGRMQRIANRRGVNVFVDYAHTPDAVRLVIDSVLRAADEAPPQSWCVLGCGGDRDREKRAQMARAAADKCRLIICDDNVRADDATRIALDMLTGVKTKPGVIVCRDRKQAIALALAQADKGAFVFILGKGDEAFIHYGARKLAHRDSECAARIGGGHA